MGVCFRCPRRSLAARPYSHREQALLHIAGQLSQHARHGLGHHRRRRARRVLLVVLLHSGPLSWVDLAVAQHLPRGRCQAGDRHLNFHETRDNLVSENRGQTNVSRKAGQAPSALIRVGSGGVVPGPRPASTSTGFAPVATRGPIP